MIQDNRDLNNEDSVAVTGCVGSRVAGPSEQSIMDSVYSMAVHTYVRLLTAFPHAAKKQTMGREDRIVPHTSTRCYQCAKNAKVHKGLCKPC
jgi:hypothetical protein